MQPSTYPLFTVSCTVNIKLPDSQAEMVALYGKAATTQAVPA